MTLWARVRGVPVIVAAGIVTLLGLVLPVSTAAVTPSPAGATLAAACFLALIVPVAVGWGCARGDPQLEAVSSQPVRSLDLALAVTTVGLAAGIAVLLERVGVAPAGVIAGRAAITYLGLLLVATPLGWRNATLTPAIYLLAVAVVGGGSDIYHPAPWAWIAALPDDAASWILTGATAGIGLIAYLVVPRRPMGDAGGSGA